MGKINFTKEHKTVLISAIANSVLNNEVFIGNLGTAYTVNDLINNTTINTLRQLRAGIAKKIASLQIDDWGDNPNQDKIDVLKKQDELINLIIGYRLHEIELAEVAKEKKNLEEQIAVLKDSEKSPAQKIAELEEKLANIDN